MDYFRTDCGVTAINRFRQQPMVLQARILPRRIGTDSKVQIHHALFCRPHHHAVHWRIHPGDCRHEEWSGRAVGAGNAEALRHTVALRTVRLYLSDRLLLHVPQQHSHRSHDTFLTPVLKALPADGKGKIGLALAIPVAANVGGMGTPIGTPPNAIALKYLNDPEGLNMNIGFGEWMSFMMPYTIIVLFIAWFILLRLFPFKQKTIQLQIEGEAQKDWRSIVVYITFAITVLLWMSDKFTGVNSNVVAMIPVAVFCITGVITKRDLEEISWSVLWMVAGGFALGVALNETGLAKHMIEAIPFNTWSPIVMIVGSGLICYAMANFISHTATAALLVPILAIAGISMRDTLQPMGGVLTLLVGVALGSSLAMVLPISTPPNALAHATGMIKQKDMEKVGLIMGAIGLILGYAMLIFLGSSGLL